jgi:hypothetical protein
MKVRPVVSEEIAGMGFPTRNTGVRRESNEQTG